MKRFHIKLTETSEWSIELGYSLAHVMSFIEFCDYSTIPYAYFVTEY
jgi:hypothetical protein